MSDRTLRHMIAAAIALLLIHQIGSLVAAAFGAAWGATTSLAVAAVSLFAARRARAGGRASLWFLLPTLLFTVIPMFIVMWRAYALETATWERIVSLLPFLVEFALPMILLLLVYYELRQRGDRATTE